MSRDKVDTPARIDLINASAGKMIAAAGNGVNWSRGSGSSFVLAGDGDKSVVVRQTDVAGNVGPTSDPFSFTLDGGPPDRPTLVLATDSGSSGTDKLTNDGTIKVGKLEAGASWQYSLDGGTTWTNGT